MRAKYLVGAAIGLLAAATVNMANAATVTLGVREDGIGAITTVGTPGAGISSFIGTFGDYGINTSATAQPVEPPSGVLGSNSLNISSSGSGSHFLDVFVTAQGNTIAALVNFISSFTLNSTLGTVATTMSSFLDTANGLFTTSGGTVTQLGAAGPFSSGPTTGVSQTSLICGASCSVTALYHVATTGAALSNATINVAVPGPIVGAGLPGLAAAACFALVALARRRRNTAIA